MNTAYFVQTACIWEVCSRKPGNVHPGASFEDTTFIDFLLSAAAIAPCFDNPPVGMMIRTAVEATRRAVGQNTNLGIILALAPLAAAADRQHLPAVLNSLTVADAEHVYMAIRLASPGGLGRTATQDVDDKPTVTLLEAMRLASDRDQIARQYATDFADVYDFGVPAFQNAFHRFGNVEAAVIECQLRWLAEFPDSLIVRKCGAELGEEVRQRARRIFQLGGLETAAGRITGRTLDAFLRGDGHRRNPGTTADLVTACLFVALQEQLLPNRVAFEWQCSNWLT